MSSFRRKVKSACETYKLDESTLCWCATIASYLTILIHTFISGKFSFVDDRNASEASISSSMPSFPGEAICFYFADTLTCERLISEALGGV